MDTRRLAKFIVVHFLVGCASDIALNDLTNYYDIPILKSLKPYFYKESIVKSSLAAGLTISMALFLNMLVSYLTLGIIKPRNLTELTYFSMIGFCLAYLIDIAIDRFKIFGDRLDTYYKEVGAGFWGAMAYLFSLIVSYFIEKLI